MKNIPGTSLPLCLICEDCKQLAIVGQQACLEEGIGPDVIASHARNNKPRRAPRKS